MTFAVISCILAGLAIWSKNKKKAKVALNPSPEYQVSFESYGLSVQKKKFKIDFQDGSHQGSKNEGSSVRAIFETLDQPLLQKDIEKKSVHNNSCFLISDFKIYTISGSIKTDKPFVNS